MSQFCIETKNHEGKRAIFTEKQRQEKAKKHPELRDDFFIENVQRTIESPTFVYEDLLAMERVVYYCREFKINSLVRYTKVVLTEDDAHFFVITAYRPDYVKERGKTKLLYGQDDD